MSTSAADEHRPDARIQPVHVEAADGPRASRALWLIKWVLVLPHVAVLVMLWLGLAVLTVGALGAILVTGRYPRRIFDFNTGVLRWSWRVAYYSFGVLGTDDYPPFTLAEVREYPAHLDVDYPERLSRGLVLLKWWLLAIPHYLVLAVLLGSGGWVVRDADRVAERVQTGGLIPLLVVVAAAHLLVTGRYPTPLYELTVGLNRWVLRVAAYLCLMTDAYPPFRLDQGSREPAGPQSGPTGP